MNFNDLSAQEKNEYIAMRIKASKEKNYDEARRLAKMYELSPRVADGIKLAFGDKEVERMKSEGYLFPEK